MLNPKHRWYVGFLKPDMQKRYTRRETIGANSLIVWTGYPLSIPGSRSVQSPSEVEALLSMDICFELELPLLMTYFLQDKINEF